MTITHPSPQIDYYKSATSTTAEGSLTLEQFIEGVQSGEFESQITTLRKRLADGDTDGYGAAKRNLPAVSVSGYCDGKRGKAVAEGRFHPSGYLQLDFDAGDNIGWTVEEIVEILRAESRIVAAFISPSGKGVKGIARIPADSSTHLGAFIAARVFFKGHNLVIDEACKDPGRLCFVSHDPGAWIDLERAAMFEPALDAAPKVAAKTKPASGGLVITSKHGAFPEPPANGIHTWLMDAAWWCRINDMSEADTVERLRSYDGSLRRPLQPTEAVDAARSAFAKPFADNADWRVGEQVAAMLTAPAGNSTMQSFDPDDVFYDGPASKYLVRVNNAFFLYGAAEPIRTGIARHLSDQFPDPKELMRAVKATVADRQLDGGIQWSGNIAGHRQGMAVDSNGLPILITSEAKPPAPALGEFPLIYGLLEQAFTDATALEVYMSWLAGRYNAVRSYTHVPSPMLVLAGEVNSGKSLLAWITTQVLGGRSANPYAAWSGGMLWNDDLIGSEVLVVDDCQAQTDIRARRNFGAAFKEAMYPHAVQLRKRHSSSISVRPVWAVVVCCNDTPESLQIIPPLDADMSDKVILLHFSPIQLPIDTSTAKGRTELQDAVRAELPALADELVRWVTPAHLRDSRSGVLAWRDPDLVDSVDSNSPARRLDDLIEAAVGNLNIWNDLPRELTALEIETRLMDSGSIVRDQARSMFTWSGACGSALARLAKMNRGRVRLGEYDTHRKVNRYRVEGLSC